jgi:putative hydrolase of the HAD superfamily
MHNKNRCLFQHTRHLGGTLALRAVVFDYGMVLTGPPDADAHDAMVRITGLPLDRFESLYWADRHAYDEGKLNGVTFWQKFLRDANLDLAPSVVDDLNRYDARMWTTQNSRMVSWQLRLAQHGLQTAILSNMGDSVLENIKREFAWIDRFDVLVWSYQLRMAKPDPKIYLYALKQLGTEPAETLFIDDKQVNVDAAIDLGMKAIQFSDVDKLRQDLVRSGLDGEVPLP